MSQASSTVTLTLVCSAFTADYGDQHCGSRRVEAARSLNTPGVISSVVLPQAIQKLGGVLLVRKPRRASQVHHFRGGAAALVAKIITTPPGSPAFARWLHAVSTTSGFADATGGRRQAGKKVQVLR
jgi:hypothetical protein